ncbi:MAG: hypothetical protein JKX78_07875 [Alteromonadaceae bacterium]|nr:hypothetical protein [Alteromonadaceae bacterium]
MVQRLGFEYARASKPNERAGLYYIVDPLQTLPIYTSLFNKLGIAAAIATLIALPL